MTTSASVRLLLPFSICFSALGCVSKDIRAEGSREPARSGAQSGEGECKVAIIDILRRIEALATGADAGLLTPDIWWEHEQEFYDQFKSAQVKGSSALYALKDKSGKLASRHNYLVHYSSDAMAKTCTIRKVVLGDMNRE